MRSRSLLFKVLLLNLLAAGLIWLSCGGEEGGGSDEPEATWDRAALLDACVRMHSCGVFQLTHVHQCIYRFEMQDIMWDGKAPMYKKLHLCVNKAKGNCTAVRACFGAKAEDPICDNNENQYQGSCNGEVAQFCDTGDKRIYRIDCAAGGLKCALDARGEPFCGAGPCSTPTQSECRLKNTQKVHCNGEGLQIKYCDWLGLTCGKDSTGKLDCIGRGKACSG
jgi:hypothetical protein